MFKGEVGTERGMSDECWGDMVWDFVENADVEFHGSLSEVIGHEAGEGSVVNVGTGEEDFSVGVVSLADNYKGLVKVSCGGANLVEKGFGEFDGYGHFFPGGLDSLPLQGGNSSVDVAEVVSFFRGEF